MENNSNADVRLALEEMRLTMANGLAAGDAIDQKTNVILVASGLLLAVLTALQVSATGFVSGWHIWLLGGTVIAYLVAVALALFVAAPRTYNLAIEASAKELQKEIFDKSERDVILKLISGYVTQIQHNCRINEWKVKLFRLSLVALFISALLMVAAVMVQSLRL